MGCFCAHRPFNFMEQARSAGVFAVTLESNCADCTVSWDPRQVALDIRNPALRSALVKALGSSKLLLLRTIAGLGFCGDCGDTTGPRRPRDGCRPTASDLNLISTLACSELTTDCSFCASKQPHLCVYTPALLGPVSNTLTVDGTAETAGEE